MVLAVTVLVLLPCSGAGARLLDTARPIWISADDVTIQEVGGQTRYRGNVEVIQADTQLSGDELLVTETGTGSNYRCVGWPAKLRFLGKDGIETLAQAETLDYDSAADKVKMRANARIDHDENILLADTITYQVAKGKAVALPGATQKRIRTIINSEHGLFGGGR